MAKEQTALFVETGRGEFGMTPLVNARRLGLQTVLLAKEPAIYTVTAADEVRFSELVDDVVKLDTNDAGAVIDGARKIAKSSDLRALFSAIDYYVPAVAAVARSLHLPGLSPTAATTARDKGLMREACERAGVPSARFAYVTSTDQLRAFCEAVGFPVVVKPLAEAASIGVRLCSSLHEAEEHFSALDAVKTTLRGQRRRPGALVEEYLAGFEVSVESVDHPEGRTCIGVVDKGSVGAPYFIEDGETFPSVLPDEVTSKCITVAHAALDAVGFDFGASHVELRVTESGPKVVEINPRMAGAAIGRLIELATGIDLQFELMRLHCGLRPDLEPKWSKGAASRYIIASRVGRVSGFIGHDVAATYPGYVGFSPFVAPGSPVSSASDNRAELAQLVFEAPSPSEAARSARAASAEIQVVFEHA